MSLPAPPPGLLRLASYNVRKAVGTDRRRNPARIAGVIAEIGADVLVLQEADRRLGDRPTALPPGAFAEATGMRPVEVAQNAVSLGWHGIALAVRPEIGVEGLAHLDLPGLEPRGAVIADLATALGPLRVVGVHLGLLRTSRRQQLSAVLAALGRMPPRPTLIAGDFNEWSARVGLGRLAPGYTIHAPGPSFHARRPIAALDRIVYDDRLALAGSGVLSTPLSTTASDHLPIWADFRVPGS